MPNTPNPGKRAYSARRRAQTRLKEAMSILEKAMDENPGTEHFQALYNDRQKIKAVLDDLRLGYPD